MNYDPNDYPEKGNGGGGGNLLPVGKHIVRVIDHELSETSSGLTQLIVNFESPRDGRSRKAWLIAEGAVGWQLATLFRAVGWTSKIDLSASGLIKKAIYGKDIEIVVEDDTYKGETKPKVKWINKAPGGFGSDGSERSSSSPRDGGRSGGGGYGYGGGGGGYGGSGGGNRDDAPPYTPDDDVPF